MHFSNIIIYYPFFPILASMLDSLLTPSLSSTQANKQISSPGFSFFVAFLGGPCAIIAFSAINSYKLRRPFDAAAYLIAVTAFFGLLFLIKHPLMATTTVWLQQQLGPRHAFYLMRCYALLLWGLFYLMHLKTHRCAALFNDTPRIPWLSALACTGFGYIALILAGWLP